MSCTIPGRATILLAPLLMFAIASPAVAQRGRTITPPTLSAPSADSLDRALVTTLSKGDREGAAMARTALPSLQDPEVKQFARQLLDEHEANLTATLIIAARLGLPVVPGSPTAASAAVVGSSDTQFIDAAVSDHEALLSQLPASGATLRDDGLRLHLVDTRQALLVHLEAARRLQARLTERRP